MTLFRCSVLKKRNSNKFLDSTGEIYAVGEVLNPIHIPDHFKRTGGILKDGVTRFGPPGYDRWPLYASEKKDTTYYEFAYWKLKDWKSEVGMQTRASLITFNFNPTDKPIDVRSFANHSSILDKSSYTESHKWILGLGNTPDSILFPSVRDPNPGGFNFAIFEGSTVSNFLFQQDVTMIIKDEFNVEVIYPNNTSVIVTPIK